MKFFLIFIVVVSLVLIGNLTIVYATDNDAPSDAEDSSQETEPTCLKDPLTGYDPCRDSSDKAPNINTMIGTVIKSVLGIVGSLALAMFVYGGFVMMLSAGNMEKVQKGRGILIWASVGLVVIFSAYAMVKFVIDGIAGTPAV